MMEDGGARGSNNPSTSGALGALSLPMLALRAGFFFELPVHLRYLWLYRPGLEFRVQPYNERRVPTLSSFIV